ncbi:MAG TPA: hypothetical protein VGR54_07390 [Nitrosopumilaceae archaeon]|nr:hypothetical protein [Nitrosopumilaceae archaeon]
MAKKICVAHGGLNNKQKKELESRIKNTVEQYNEELQTESEQTGDSEE